jgi:tetratricopeptide (TPR) repeat protein
MLGRIFCQRCRTPNSVTDESCAQCGTRLMLVVEPSGQRYEDATQAGGSLDEHLLERVSLLENNLSRVIDRLEKTLDLLLKQAQSSHTSHTLLDALIGTLAETGALDSQLLKARLLKRDGRASVASVESGPKGEQAAILAQIVARHDGAGGEAFARTVLEGLEFIAAGRLAAAGRRLEEAAAASPENGPLDALTGRVLLAGGRPERAASYLLRAAGSEPGEAQLAGLLGLALGEAGDAERARELLREAIERGASTFLFHFALGRLAAARRQWREALKEFKLALARRECAEALYQLGAAHLQLGHGRAAVRELRRAVALDEGYAAAWELLARSFTALGETAQARQARAAARRAAAKASGAKSATPRPARRLGERRAQRLLTGGEPRLLKLFAEELLGAPLSR